VLFVGRLASDASLVEVPKERGARYAFGDRTVRWRDVTGVPVSALTKGEGHYAPLEGNVDEVEVTGQSAAPANAGRHRLHRSPARGHAMKVLYGDDEWALIVQAAQMLGLRPSGYVASAALSAAQLAVHPPQTDGTGRRRWVAAPAADRELLLELMQSRNAVNRYGVNVNQAVAALHSVGQAPVWLEQAVVGARRAVERVDEAAALVARRLSRGRG